MASKKARIVCYDDYVWRAGMSRKCDLPIRPGESFQPYFLENLRQYNGVIVSRVSQASKIVWAEGAVEILVFDAPKSWRELGETLRRFAHALVPGETRLVFQDYLHFPSFEIALLLSQLPVSPEYVVRGGSTLSFLLADDLTHGLAETSQHHWTKWDTEKYFVTWESILAPLPDDMRLLLELAIPLGLLERGDDQAAKMWVTKLSLDEKSRRYAQRKLEGASAVASVRYIELLR
jgi:hypothetical protein